MKSEMSLKLVRNALLIGIAGVLAGRTSINIIERSLSAMGFLTISATAGVAVLLLALVRPVLVAIAFLGLSFVNPSIVPELIEFGGFSVRWGDVFFVMLGVGILIRLTTQQRIIVSKEFRQQFGPLLLFLVYVGASLITVAISIPHRFAASAASYLRLVETSLFALLLHLAIRNSHDMDVFHKALVGFSLATVVIGLWEAYIVFATAGLGSEELFGGRFGGLLGINSLGLVSGLLVLYALITRDAGYRLMQWGGPLTLGLLGLFLAKSVSSIFATAGVVIVYLAAMRFKRGGITGLLRFTAVGTAMAVAAALAIWFLRRSDISGLFELSGGSFAQRLMIAYAGFLIFGDHPLVGVGWQASATEEFIGSPALNEALMERFSRFPEHYFFLEKPTSLHNMYIQFLAELGITGFVVFAYGCFRTGKSVIRIIQNIHAGSPYRVWARFYAFGLLFLLLWWNAQPLYGGQIESVLAFTFLSALASVARLEKRRIIFNNYLRITTDRSKRVQ